MTHALDGIKVVDFSTSGAGPFAATCLSEHGAQVVKVESMALPDITRVSEPYVDRVPGINRGGFFILVNGGKYSLALNLKYPHGIDVAKRLVGWADIVVESFAPGTMKRLGLGYDELKKVKPDLIMLSTSMMGQTGPLASHPGFGWGMKGLAGFVHLTGWPDREASGMSMAYTDAVVPWLGVVAVMAAFDYRARTGLGIHVDLSHLESGLSFISPALLDYTANRRVQTRTGNRSSYAVPHGVYRCAGDDRWCAISVLTDGEWSNLCEVLGSSSWTRQTRFATLANRRKNEDALDRLIEGETVSHNAEELVAKLQSARVTAGVVQNCQDIFETDPQLKHRSFFNPVPQAGMGAHMHMGWPAKLSKTPPEYGAAPEMGEHTEYVCTKLLKMVDDEFVALLSEGIFT